MKKDYTKKFSLSKTKISIKRMEKPLLILIVTNALIASGWLIYKGHSDFKNASIAQCQNQLLLHSKITANEINRFLNIIKDDIKLISSNEKLAGILKRCHNVGSKTCSIEIKNIIDKYSQFIGNYISSIFILNYHRKPLRIVMENGGSDSSCLSNEVLTRIQKSRSGYTSSVIIMKDCKNHIELAEPVLYENEVVGFIIAIVTIETLAENFIEPIKPYKTGYAWLMNNDGTILWHANKKIIGMKMDEAARFLAPQTDLSSLKKIFDAMLNGKEGVGLYKYSAWRKSKTTEIAKIVGYAQIKGVEGGCSIATCVEYSEIAGPIFEHAKKVTLHSAIFLTVVLFGILSFISVRKKAEKKLAEEREIRLATMRSISESVITTTISGKIIVMNQSAEKLFGCREKELKGKLINEAIVIFEEESKIPFKFEQEVIVKSGSAIEFPGYYKTCDKNGKERIITISASPVKNPDGETSGIVFVMKDVTEKVKLEREIFRKSKLESLGVLAGGIAHDFNNILTVVMGNISMAKFNIDKNSESHHFLLDAEKAICQAKNLTLQFLTFSKGGEPIKQPLSLGKIIKNTAEIATKGSNVKCEYYIAEDLYPVEGDEGQMSQVIYNLVLNSVQAMEKGGKIKISGENALIQEQNEKLKLHKGRYVKITVKDYGIGIPAGIIDRIFDPYFTTKKAGAGLGLSVVYSIIKKHAGTITVSSEEGKGSTFTIYLPASDRPVFNEKITTPEITYGKGLILLMEDKEEIRTTTKKMIESLGYKVITASNGEEAITVYKRSLSRGDKIDAVIIDLTVVDGMGGKETIQQLLKIDKNVKGIVSSGYSNDPIMANYSKYGFMGRMKKPYNLEEISKILKKVISQSNSKK